MKTTRLLILLAGLLLISCDKNIEFTIEGRIMIDCETPLSNAELEIHDANKNELISTFMTDEDGYFKATYPKIKGRIPGILQKESKVSIIGMTDGGLHVYYPAISGNRNLNLETLPVLRVKKSFDVILNVENPYDASYTLVLPDYTQPNPTAHPIEIVGPFISGIVYNAENALLNWITNTTNFTQPNSFNTLEVEYLFSCQIVGPNDTKHINQKASFGLQCETGNFQVILTLN